MKRILLSATLLLTLQASAQRVTVQKQSDTFNGNMVQALTVYFDTLEYKDLSKQWTSFLKDHEAKVRSNKEAVDGDNAKFLSLSNDTVDVYSKIIKGDDNQLLVVAFQTKDGFLSENNQPVNFQAAEKIVKDFAVSVKKNQLAEKIKKAQGVLDDYTKEVNSLIKKNESMSGDNEKMKKQIADNEKQIKENESKLETGKVNVGVQTKTVESLREFSSKIE